MQITVQIKIEPTAEQSKLLEQTLTEYIGSVNTMLGWMYTFESLGKLTSRNAPGDIPSALRCQCAQDARSIYRSFKQGTKKRLPVLKRPAAVWNNQNYSISERSVTFPMQNGRTKRYTVTALITPEQYAVLSTHKTGTLRITRKCGKWIAQIAYECEEVETAAGCSMGVDLGIKCPAVCITDGGKVKFIGNGRKNKQMRRRFSARRKTLQKKGKLRAVKKLNDKEQRIMRDTDHKLSRQIVDWAVSRNVGTIKLEKLQNIRKKTRQSRKNNRSINTWSFYRLAQYIEYKAKLAGINVIYVNPAYTSQKCPQCGAQNKAKDRTYTCGCGYHGHRDVVGAKNILAA